ncbi:13733_t:CDS:2 [Dentiscutata heterogama]|uniref:13733_t:CDS:1 n=1 Tax=Dentiscutata heterogama TaxID=1316150 RepID=A0ACA9KMA1_9GLOM|nr:13733_t:CDS:2 [Dentiscutata heterogama]
MLPKDLEKTVVCIENWLKIMLQTQYILFFLLLEVKKQIPSGYVFASQNLLYKFQVCTILNILPTNESQFQQLSK